MIRLSTATALGVILASSPALAEITPSSVWEQLSGYYETMGMTVKTDAVEEAGDTVTVRGLVLSQETAAAEASSTKIDFAVGDVVLTATGDGGVTLDMADQATATMTIEVPMPAEAPTDAPADPAAAPTDAPAEPAATDAAKTGTLTVEMATNNPGETITVHEEGAANVYQYTFPTFALNVTRVTTAEGKVLENLGSFTLTNFTGTDRIESGESFKLDQTGAADSLAINFNYADESGAAVGNMTIAALSYTSAAIVPPGTNMGPELATALKAGLDVKGSFKAGATEVKVDVTNSGGEAGPQPMAIASTTDSMTLDFLMAEGRLGYAGTSGVSKTDVTVPDLPFPISYAAEGARFNVELPVNAAPEPQPFTFVYGFTGLTLSDGIWGMFDPQSILPRDPANVTVDLSGTARLDVDLMDTDAMSDPNVTPGAFNSLKINKVDISAVGANVSATGDLTSPEGGDLTTPVGTINGRLTGINPLFDKLVQAGLMPEDQAMGMRMMLAMFAKPDGADANVLISDIEFKADGSIFANGQQVK